MGIFYLLLLLFLIFFILIPIIRFIIFYYQARSRVRNMFDQMNVPNPSNTDEQTTQQHPHKHKKIDPTIGEYIEFEEFTEPSTKSESSTEPKTKSNLEPRITDAEWEEI